MAKCYGTYIALDGKGNRISISQVPPLDVRRKENLRYTCEICHGELVARTGQVRAHCFAHKSAADCDGWAQPMSDWHRKWQETFPVEHRENVLREDGREHRADILLPATGSFPPQVVEFQHSPISLPEMEKRNAFYANDGRELFWVFDWRDKVPSVKLRNRDETVSVGEALPGQVFTLDYGRRLPSWTGAFEPHEYIGHGAPGIHVLLQLTGDGARGLLFDVFRFGYDTVRGSLVDACEWRAMLDGDYSRVACASFDMTCIGRGVKTVEGALGAPVPFPDPDTDQDVRWMRNKERVGSWQDWFFTSGELSFRLELVPVIPVESLAPPPESNSDFFWYEPGDAAAKEGGTAGQTELQAGSGPLCEPAELAEACKGGLIYLPPSSPRDAAFHGFDPDVHPGPPLQPGFVLSGVSSKDDGFPYIVTCRMMVRGAPTKEMALVLADRGSQDEQHLVEFHEANSNLSMLCVDLSQYGGTVDGPLGLLDLVDFVLGKDARSRPCDHGSARQWLFNEKERRKQG